MFGVLASLVALSGCRATPKIITLDIVTFNYYNRPIYDVFINDAGGGTSTAYPATGGGTIMGEQLRLGPQKVTWKLDGKIDMPNNGQTVIARNIPQLVNVPSDSVFLSVHVYPDETVELIPTVHYPSETEKGKVMALAAGATH